MTTTTNLGKPTRPRRWVDLSPPIAAAICIFCLLSLAAIIGRVRSAQQAAAVPTPALGPIIIIASPLPFQPPTAVPPAAQIAAVVPGNVTVRAIGVFGAPDTASYIGSVEAGRTFAPVARYGSEWVQVDMSGGTGVVFMRTSDLYGVPELVDLQPTSAPIIVEQPIYVAAPMLAAPTPAPELAVATPTTDEYQVMSDEQPSDDFYTTPPHMDPAAQQALIGSDPNALACNGSVFCGGLTNAEAQAALDAQRAGR